MLAEDFISSRSHAFILRCQRAATDQVPTAAVLRVNVDLTPKTTQSTQIPVILMNTGTAQLNNFGAERLQGRKIEFLSAVVSQALPGTEP